jgi:glycosyltransferase involved in cell wall biosynthesis
LEGVRDRLRRRFGLNEPYILYVGALTLRKNIARALEAFAELNSSHPGLCFVLAGPSTWKKTPIASLLERLGITERVLLTGPLTDDDLPALYNGADLFVFPSLYEGFGLPPLEAMACGTPVVTSNASSLPEVVGDAAITVDPYDVDALSGAMRRVLTDPCLRDEMRQKGLARASGFTWERTARETVSVYRQVLAS